MNVAVMRRQYSPLTTCSHGWWRERAEAAWLRCMEAGVCLNGHPLAPLRCCGCEQ